MGGNVMALIPIFCCWARPRGAMESCEERDTRISITVTFSTTLGQSWERTGSSCLDQLTGECCVCVCGVRLYYDVCHTPFPKPRLFFPHSYAPAGIYLDYSPPNVMYAGWVGDQDPDFKGLENALKRYLQSAWAGM